MSLISVRVNYILGCKYMHLGTLDRSMVAGVTAFDVIAAFMVTEGSLVVFQVVLSFIIMVFGFGLTIQGSSILFFFLLLLNGISGLSLGKYDLFHFRLMQKCHFQLVI